MFVPLDLQTALHEPVCGKFGPFLQVIIFEDSLAITEVTQD